MLFSFSISTNHFDRRIIIWYIKIRKFRWRKDNSAYCKPIFNSTWNTRAKKMIIKSTETSQQWFAYKEGHLNLCDLIDNRLKYSFIAKSIKRPVKYWKHALPLLWYSLSRRSRTWMVSQKKKQKKTRRRILKVIRFANLLLRELVTSTLDTHSTFTLTTLHLTWIVGTWKKLNKTCLQIRRTSA